VRIKIHSFPLFPTVPFAVLSKPGVRLYIITTNPLC
jgi:hypothetical protein